MGKPKDEIVIGGKCYQLYKEVVLKEDVDEVVMDYEGGIEDYILVIDKIGSTKCG